MGLSSQDGNLVAQLETVFSVATGVLRKDGGTNVRASNDLGGECAIAVIGAEQKRLDGALCETVKERKHKESYGGPVQSDPQVLDRRVVSGEKSGGLVTHDNSRRILQRSIPDRTQACWWGRLMRATDQLRTKRAKVKERREVEKGVSPGPTVAK